MARRALASATVFLGRWRDPFTQNECDDLAQETALVVWRQVDRIRVPGRLPAMARTISQRLRCRALCVESRRGARIDDLAGLPEPADESGEDTTMLMVGGRPVERRALLELLPPALDRLGGLNRALLLGFYEGFSCSELGDRFCLSEDGVKLRLYRGRKVLRKSFEVRVRVADGLGE